MAPVSVSGLLSDRSPRRCPPPHSGQTTSRAGHGSLRRNREAMPNHRRDAFWATDVATAFGNWDKLASVAIWPHPGRDWQSFHYTTPPPPATTTTALAYHPHTAPRSKEPTPLRDLSCRFLGVNLNSFPDREPGSDTSLLFMMPR
ncbi:unnamed protein product [Pleuronectes platessa]|uniref:Uncharacterized protein n=1 Tax=Pleuronectes platessa TaxID=8262 RepID=A0A9N7U4J9_PLEPL|nr:unnamed protein product [Pleuronectes platessa]